MKTLFLFLLSSALFSIGCAQTPEVAKLGQFFDRLAEKNKAMGSLSLVKDGHVISTKFIDLD